MLTDFYGSSASISFTILALWFVVAQTRYADWMASPEHRRRASAVSLHFALPGLMSLLSLADPQNAGLWRVTFTLAGALGAVAWPWSTGARRYAGAGPSSASSTGSRSPSTP